jgi:hypothetical protein
LTAPEGTVTTWPRAGVNTIWLAEVIIAIGIQNNLNWFYSSFI